MSDSNDLARGGFIHGLNTTDSIAARLERGYVLSARDVAAIGGDSIRAYRKRIVADETDNPDE